MKTNIFISKLLMLLIAGLIFMIPFQAIANLTYTMTDFQSLGPLYASGEITGDLTGSMTMPIVYSFCVDNAALLYEGQPYSASLTSIAGNPGLLESAYLINTYVPQNSALTNVNTGVALQWAILGIPVKSTRDSEVIQPRVPLQSDPSATGITERWVEATMSQGF